MLAFTIFGDRAAFGYGSRLAPGERLYANQNQQLTSANQGFKLVMQTDGNLVLYTPTGRVLWSSGTYGQPVSALVMQAEDGNLVIYSTSWTPLWASNSGYNPGAYLDLQDDGNAVIYRTNGTDAWSTGTYNARNTESYGNGDCWRVGTPATCRSNWPGRSQFIRFRAIDHFSDSRPNWMSSAQAAVSAWNSAPGPQLYSFTPQTNDTWVYLEDARTGEHGLPPGYGGVTWNCQQGVPCDRLVGLEESIIAHWSEIYFNRDVLPNTSNSLVKFVFAHESGHAMLLHHNFVDPTALMRPNADVIVPGPNANDTGAFPGCAGGGFGVNCIYGWGN